MSSSYEFKRKMVNFWMMFWSIISKLTKTVLLKGKHLKNIFLNDVQFHKCQILSWSTWKKDWWRRRVFFSVQKWVVRSNWYMFSFGFKIVRRQCFKFESRLCFLYSAFLEQDSDVHLTLEEMAFFWMIFWMAIFDIRQCYRRKNISELVWERSLLFILNNDQVHSKFLNEQPITSNFVLRVFAIDYVWTRAVSLLERAMLFINEVVLLFLGQFKNI